METNNLPGADEFFDEPAEPAEVPNACDRIHKLMEAASGMGPMSRNGFLRFIQWMSRTPDKERQVILYVFSYSGGIIGSGDVNRIINGCGVSRSVYFRALKRFDEFFPGVVER